MFITILHGRPVRRVGHRYFAIPKSSTGLADRIAEASHAALDGNQWDRIMSSPIGGHVICNQKRADARRDARWRRTVVKARFT